MKHNRHSPGNSESGAMAMITVVFLALLLSIMTLSFVRLSVREQRQAIDDSLTNRAFYAAESGLEDAKRALQRNFDTDPGNDVVLNATSCRAADLPLLTYDTPANPDAVVLSADLNTFYTCQLIDLSPPDYQAELDEWGAVTLPLVPAGGGAFSNVVIEWHQKGPSPYNGDYVLPASAATPNLDDYGTWRTGVGRPAMLRAQFFSTPASGNLSRASFASTAGFLRPSDNGLTTAQSVSAVGYDKNVLNFRCEDLGTISDGEYACTAILSGFDSSRLNYLHLNSLYRSTNVRVSLVSSTGSELPMQDAQAIVDVTGRASDVYRRIEARVALTQVYPLPDYAIWANEEICKDFTIASAAALPSPSAFYTNTCEWAP